MFSAWLARRPANRSHVESNQVIVPVESRVSKLVIQPRRIEEHWVQNHDSGFLGVEATDVVECRACQVVYRCIVVFAVEVDVGHSPTRSGIDEYELRVEDVRGKE